MELYIVFVVFGGMVALKLLDILLKRAFKNLGEETISKIEFINEMNALEKRVYEKMQHVDTKITQQLVEIKKMIVILAFKKCKEEIEPEEINKLLNGGL